MYTSGCLYPCLEAVPYVLGSSFDGVVAATYFS